MVIQKRIVYIFNNGEKMVDRNKFSTIAQARSWARASNRNEPKKGWRVAKVVQEEIKSRKRKVAPKRNVFGFAQQRMSFPKMKAFKF
jgi:hypothetical protein